MKPNDTPSRHTNLERSLANTMEEGLPAQKVDADPGVLVRTSKIIGESTNSHDLSIFGDIGRAVDQDRGLADGGPKLVFELIHGAAARVCARSCHVVCGFAS
jgi:hypothetical protein